MRNPLLNNITKDNEHAKTKNKKPSGNSQKVQPQQKKKQYVQQRCLQQLLCLKNKQYMCIAKKQGMNKVAAI